MATIEQLSAALVKADAAGNVDDAKALAAAIRGMQGGQPSRQSQVMTDALAAGSAASQRLSRQPQQPMSPDLMGSTAATLGGIVNGIPILGPAVQKTSDAMLAGGGMLADQFTGNQGPDLGGRMQSLEDRRGQLAAANPIADISGQLAGGVGAFGAASKIPAAATALGNTGGLLTRIGNSALSSAGISGADALVRGKRGGDVASDMALGGAIGGAVPIVGEGLRLAGRAVFDNIARPIGTAFNRENEAIRRIGVARTQGLNNPAAPVMTQADEAMAASAGAPVINADRGGAPLRTLARTAANVSPEASATLTRTAQDRFETQAPRAVGFIQRLMGGATDDLALQESLRAGARRANGPAYRAAYDAPAARAVWTPEIQNLMQAGPFRNAINAAEDTATNAAAVSGGRAVRNPFVFRPDGTATLRVMPDGSRALPNLEFWDIVQRNLRTSSDIAARNGDNLLAGQIRDMRTQLNIVLDNAVPQFNQARRGAAQFFGAEDAIEAGQLFARTPRSIPEATRAHARFTPAERDAFSVGYASDLIDTIKASRDRVNVINQVFGSQARREMNALALGPHRARELEAYVRMESILDGLRTAVTGNSTTAQQLIAAGVIGGAGGYFGSGGDIQSGFTAASIAALGRRGLQVMGKRVDERVMARIGEILASGDERLLQRAIQNAALSQQHQLALEAIQRGLEMSTKGAALSVVGQN